MLDMRRASIEDAKLLRDFTDCWLSGRGMAQGVKGAVNDCFISPSQHRKYISKYKTFLCFSNGLLIGWSVVEPNGTLIHFLIHGLYRRSGVGQKFLRWVKPESVRCKNDQSSGDPTDFYTKNGYKVVGHVRSRSRFDIDHIRPVRPKNITILEKI